MIDAINGVLEGRSMSKPILNDEGRVLDRNGEFYKISSCYSLPTDPGMKRTPWKKFMVDVDELQNKPRRFFDNMLSLIEAQRDNDALIDEGNHREYWDYLVRGCEMWLSAVENGLYGDVIRLAEPLDEEGRKLREDYLEEQRMHHD